MIGSWSSYDLFEYIPSDQVHVPIPSSVVPETYIRTMDFNTNSVSKLPGCTLSVHHLGMVLSASDIARLTTVARNT